MERGGSRRGARPLYTEARGGAAPKGQWEGSSPMPRPRLTQATPRHAPALGSEGADRLHLPPSRLRPRRLQARPRPARPTCPRRFPLPSPRSRRAPASPGPSLPAKSPSV